MNKFEEAYLNTVVRNPCESIIDNNGATEQLTDEQRDILATVLAAAILSDEDDENE